MRPALVPLPPVEPPGRERASPADAPGEEGAEEGAVQEDAEEAHPSAFYPDRACG